jgi:UDP:flavonoid glycosyltransferase YjiC (YdhE family)
MGSEMIQSLDRQYELFSQTCLRLRRPGLMISSGWKKPVPKTSSIDFRVVNSAPYSQLFPHASVVLTHGGIGTLAKAIAARRPVITAPMAYDQFDNGHLAEKLGIGISIPFRSMNTMNLGRAVEAAQDISPIAFGPTQRAAAAAACDLIEKGSASAVPEARINNF